MIVKKNLNLYEEYYNEGYESAIKDIMKILNGKTTSKKQKQIYEELVNELMNSFEKHKE